MKLPWTRPAARSPLDLPRPEPLASRPAPAAAPPPPPAGAGAYAVELHDAGRAKISVIKELRAFRSMGLRDAKLLVDRADHQPTVIAHLSEERANAFVVRLTEVGARAVVLPPASGGARLGGAGGPTGAGDVPGLIAKLGDLHAAGVLTDDEFQAKKTELLDRL